MKKIIFICSILLLSNNCLAASSGSNGKTDLYKSAKKQILKAKKLEKKDKVEKALTLYLKAWTISLPIAIGTALFVGPLAKKFVDKITK